MEPTTKMLQLLPATPEWSAAFLEPSSKDVTFRPVLMWALCADGERTKVHGVVCIEGQILPVSDCPAFVGYLDPTLTVTERKKRISMFRGVTV